MFQKEHLTKYLRFLIYKNIYVLKRIKNYANLLYITDIQLLQKENLETKVYIYVPKIKLKSTKTDEE